MFTYDNQCIYVDPSSSSGQDFTNLPKADLVLITHSHGDHLDKSTLKLIVNDDTKYLSNEVSYKELQKGKSIKNNENVLPCFIWNDKSDIRILNSFYKELKDNFSTFAIRMVEFLNLKKHITNIRTITDFHIILDMNTSKDIDFIESIITTIKHENFSSIIYLGTPFIGQDLTIPSDSLNINSNVIKVNTSIRVKKDLDKLGHTDVKYGDYCGYDRRTLIKHPKGGTPTARVVLLSLEPTETILIRRGWDSRDRIVRAGGRTLIGAKHSMNRLLKDLHDGVVDFEKGVKYLDEALVDVDEALKSQYPGKIIQREVKVCIAAHIPPRTKL